MTTALTPNQYNATLALKHQGLQRAYRYALGTVCDPTTRKPVATSGRRLLKHIQINATAAGDNIVIPPLAGAKRIMELFMWNVAAQDIIWQQGTTGNNNIVLSELPSFPATSGFVLGMVPRWDLPHWEIDNNQPLVLNLSVGTQVTGFIRYSVDNGITNDSD
jgi:hypothetical protein